MIRHADRRDKTSSTAASRRKNRAFGLGNGPRGPVLSGGAPAPNPNRKAGTVGKRNNYTFEKFQRENRKKKKKAEKAEKKRQKKLQADGTPEPEDGAEAADPAAEDAATPENQEPEK